MLKRYRAANVQQVWRAQSCKRWHLPVGVPVPPPVCAYSRVPARSNRLTCMHPSPWLYSFTCTFSTCFSVLPVATVISFSLCSLGCFAASYFTMSLFIPFHNNNIKTYIQGPKVPALCRYIRKDPSKPACWRGKILIVSRLPGLAEAKGLIVEYDLYKTPCYILCPCWNVQSKDAGLV